MIEVLIAATEQQHRAAQAFLAQLSRESGQRTLTGQLSSGSTNLELPPGARLLLAIDTDKKAVVGLMRHQIGANALSDWGRDAYGVATFSATWPGITMGFSTPPIVAPHPQASEIFNQMLAYLYVDLQRQGIEFDFCLCPPFLLYLYTHLGYRYYKPNVVEPTAGYRVPLVLAVSDKEHLEEKKSPLARLAMRRVADPAIVDWLVRNFPEWDALSRGRFLRPGQLLQFLQQGEHQEPQLFQGLTAEDVTLLARSGSLLRCQKGDRIIRQGDLGQEMFVVLDGTVSIQAVGPGQTVEMARIGPGGIFGEVAFVLNTIRTADTVAESAVTLLVLTPAHVEVWRKLYPELAWHLLLNMCKILGTRMADLARQRAHLVPRPDSDLPAP